MSRKSLLFLSFLAVLSGCYTSPCVAPDLLSPDPIHNCYYQLQVVDIGQNNFITAKVPERLYLLDEETNKGREPFTRPSSSRATQEEANNLANRAFMFHVLDFQGKQVEKGKTYEFVREGNSSSLEFVRELVPQKP